MTAEYRVVPSQPDAPRPYRVEVRDQTGWKFARWARTEADGKRIVAGVKLLNRAVAGVASAPLAVRPPKREGHGPEQTNTGLRNAHR